MLPEGYRLVTRKNSISLAKDDETALLVRSGELTPFWVILQAYAKGLRYPWQIRDNYGVNKGTVASNRARFKKLGLFDIRGNPNNTLLQIAAELEYFMRKYKLPCYVK